MCTVHDQLLCRLASPPKMDTFLTNIYLPKQFLKIFLVDVHRRKGQPGLGGWSPLFF